MTTGTETVRPLPPFLPEAQQFFSLSTSKPHSLAGQQMPPPPSTAPHHLASTVGCCTSANAPPLHRCRCSCRFAGHSGSRQRRRRASQRWVVKTAAGRCSGCPLLFRPPRFRIVVPLAEAVADEAAVVYKDLPQSWPCPGSRTPRHRGTSRAAPATSLSRPRCMGNMLGGRTAGTFEYRGSSETTGTAIHTSTAQYCYPYFYCSVGVQDNIGLVEPAPTCL